MDRINSLEDHLTSIMQQLEKISPGRTVQAMRYCLLAPAKRVRPRLLFCVTNSFGADNAEALHTATALEMIHTYSLIHDDLPAMDNYDLRRGKPTCHIFFGEATAILAGDGLLTLAFGQLALLKPPHCVKVLEAISGFAGVGCDSAMIVGQDIDINTVPETYHQYQEIAINKTGGLFSGALVAGALLSDKPQYIEAFKAIGKQLGIVFQIQDDLLEVQSDEKSSGKSHSDVRNNKVTAVTLLGYNGAKTALTAEFEQLSDLLNGLPREFPALLELIDELMGRNS